MTKRSQQQPTAPVATSSARGVTATPVLAQKKAAGKANKRKAVPRQQHETNALEKGHNSAVTDVVDIDEIFKSAKKRPKSAPVTQEVQRKQVRKVEGSKDDIFALGQPKGRRYDPEGLPVYSPEELNVGGGGDTDQCPFECTCCF